jgi:hypothetical protein
MSHPTKHLYLVESTVTDAYCKLESTYDAAKGKALNYTPDFVAKAINQLESILQPILTFGQKGASNVLLYADSTVCCGPLYRSYNTENYVHFFLYALQRGTVYRRHM